MAGTSWPALTAGKKAKGSDVELKFDWIEGSIHPMSAGVEADNTYDLGSATYQWRTVYAGTSILINGIDVRLYAFLLGG